MTEQESCYVLVHQLKSLSVFRDLLQEPILQHSIALLDAICCEDGETALTAWSELCAALGKAGVQGIGEWLFDSLRYSDAPWPHTVEEGKCNPFLERAARREVEILSNLASLESEELRATLLEVFQNFLMNIFPQFSPEDVSHILEALPLPLWETGASFSFDELKACYQKHGAGLFARYRAFVWESGHLLPVASPDAPGAEELRGYRLQRGQVEANTRALLAGHLVNNVLLFGESGTGKSATVKSLLHLPGAEDLRLIEIQKDSAALMPELIRQLGGRRQKFILFLDDLAFDQDDRTYGVLKTILEGGLELRPANVAIYATSNRRNLVRQNFSDRGQDEVERNETIQEKTALADRFGLRIPYLGLSQSEYLELTAYLADRAGLVLPPEDLKRQALLWDRRHPGRTPRTAQQFIASLHT